MPKKKDIEKEGLSAEETLNRRVDAMLDPKLPDPVTPKNNAAPPLDIFKDAPAAVAKATKTAPEVAGDLLKKVDSDTDDQPVTKPKGPKKERAAPKPAKQPALAPPMPGPAGQDRTTPLDDGETDRAVDDIAAHEGDTMLALQDAIARKKGRQADDKPGRSGRTAGWLILLLLAVLMFLLIAPYNSYTCRWPVGIRLRLTTDILPSVCK